MLAKVKQFFLAAKANSHNIVIKIWLICNHTAKGAFHAFFWIYVIYMQLYTHTYYMYINIHVHIQCVHMHVRKILVPGRRICTATRQGSGQAHLHNCITIAATLQIRFRLIKYFRINALLFLSTYTVPVCVYTYLARACMYVGNTLSHKCVECLYALYTYVRMA